MLDKYSALTIGLTLITIGGLGLYETLAESPSIVESNTEVPPTMEAAGSGMSCILTNSPMICAGDLLQQTNNETVSR